MLTQERFDKIVSSVEVRNSVTVSELAEALGVSESTIRRDLIALDRIGRIKKVHGGATAVSRSSVINEDDMNTKLTLHIYEKEQIGKLAAGLISNNDMVFIDAGTTTMAMINYINEGVRATFVTNGIVHAKKLIGKGLSAYIIGGRIKLTTEAVIGTAAIGNMQKYNFTKAFIGTNGISIKSGYSTPDIEEAAVKTEALKRSARSYILADSSKFEAVSAITFGELRSAAIITEELLDNDYREYTMIKEAAV